MQPIQSNRLQLNRMPQKSDVFLAAALGLAAFFLWNHPDIIETAQYTRILLDDVFSGRFFAFYQDTMDARAMRMLPTITSGFICFAGFGICRFTWAS